MAGSSAEDTLSGGGETGALVRNIDWSTTPLGPASAWPQSLRTAAGLLLGSRFPMYLAWGPRHVQLYNDEYRQILGSKHPAALGRPAEETFAEGWHVVGPRLEEVRRGGTLSSTDLLLPLERRGYLEECFFTFSCSPVRDESGAVGGVFVAVTETTAHVIGARRSRSVQGLAERTALAKTPEEACAIAASELRHNPADVPFVLFYLTSADGQSASLAGWAGLLDGSPALAPEVVFADAAQPWPLGTVAATGQVEVVTDLGARFGALPGGPWPEAAHTAVVVPIAHPGQERPQGLMVAGVSPRRALDQDYRSFFSLVASHVGTAVTHARVADAERRRSEQLAEIDRAKTAFFRNVSHELRTPLTLVLGSVEEALATPDAGSAADAAADRVRWALVQRSALRLSKLVNTLLDVSRVESGRIEASYEPTALGPVTADLASMFRAAIERAGLRLVLDLEPFDEPVYVDRDMWEKMVLNLLSNAVKFTLEGEITVSLRRVGAHVELTVRDTGTGIPASELPRLFERFRGAKGTRARSLEGTGIGLALVHDLAHLHGGSVSVDSVEGRGSAFTVRLRRGSAHLPADWLRASKTLASTAIGPAPYVAEALRWLPLDGEREVPPGHGAQASPAGRRLRILVVDDNADMREYLARLLRERWDVEAVSDGVQALAAVARQPPNLVLSDVLMPQLDGTSLVRALRAEPATRAIPVILLTARAGEEATADGFGAGANDYLVKPFTARELLMHVAAQLAVSAAGREAHAVAEAERARLYNHFMQAAFPIGVLRGPEHVFELANERALKLWGKTPSILGEPIRQAFPELVDQPFIGYLDDVFRTGVTHEGGEALARLPRGPGGALEDTWWNFVYAPLLDHAARVEGVLVCGFDVTAQVLARREVESALAEAARLNGELTEARKSTEALLAEVSQQAHEMESAVRSMRTAKDAAEQRLRELGEPRDP